MANEKNLYFWFVRSCLKLHQREREMFYLMTHSTHFIYGYMVKDHSDSEKENPLPPHRLLFPINSKGSFICTIPQTENKLIMLLSVLVCCYLFF